MSATPILGRIAFGPEGGGRAERPESTDNGPKIPVPGAAGASIFTALKSLAMRPGAGQITITKKPVPGGGYVYWVSNLTNPTN